MIVANSNVWGKDTQIWLAVTMENKFMACKVSSLDLAVDCFEEKLSDAILTAKLSSNAIAIIITTGWKVYLLDLNTQNSKNIILPEIDVDTAVNPTIVDFKQEESMLIVTVTDYKGLHLFVIAMVGDIQIKQYYFLGEISSASNIISFFCQVKPYIVFVAENKEKLSLVLLTIESSIKEETYYWSNKKADKITLHVLRNLGLNKLPIFVLGHSQGIDVFKDRLWSRQKLHTPLERYQQLLLPKTDHKLDLLCMHIGEIGSNNYLIDMTGKLIAIPETDFVYMRQQQLLVVTKDSNVLLQQKKIFQPIASQRQRRIPITNRELSHILLWDPQARQHKLLLWQQKELVLHNISFYSDSLKVLNYFLK